MNSTGICVNAEGSFEYYLLATQPTHKMEKAIEEAEGLELIKVRKETCMNGEKSKRKSIFQQINTTENIAYMSQTIADIIACYKPDYVVIEAPAFAAKGRVADLAGLNHAIRLECYKQDIPFYPVAPTTVKAHSVGNGWATKEMMIETWNKLQPQSQEWIDAGIKVDDLADAYFLCTFDLESVDIEPGE